LAIVAGCTLLPAKIVVGLNVQLSQPEAPAAATSGKQEQPCNNEGKMLVAHD
jgi:hypothetical protein